jgi:predicted transcriptional regulator
MDTTDDTSKPGRISARLDADTQGRLERIQAQTRMSVTQVVSDAVALYYDALREKTARNNQQLTALAGLFEGPADLSERSREAWSQSVDDKHTGHR